MAGRINFSYFDPFFYQQGYIYRSSTQYTILVLAQINSLFSTSERFKWWYFDPWKKYTFSVLNTTLQKLITLPQVLEGKSQNCKSWLHWKLGLNLLLSTLIPPCSNTPNLQIRLQKETLVEGLFWTIHVFLGKPSK